MFSSNYFSNESEYKHFDTSNNGYADIIIQENADKKYHTLMRSKNDEIVNIDPHHVERKCKSKKSMDVITNLYVGTLSVVGLFIIYKLLAMNR